MLLVPEAVLAHKSHRATGGGSEVFRDHQQHPPHSKTPPQLPGWPRGAESSVPSLTGPPKTLPLQHRLQHTKEKTEQS